MDSSAFAGLDKFFYGLCAVLLLSLPLAIWKIFDILLWVYNHVSVTWGN